MAGAIYLVTNDQPEFSETGSSHRHLPMKYPGRTAWLYRLRLQAVQSDPEHHLPVGH